jgi:hypothetical protein
MRLAAIACILLYANAAVASKLAGEAAAASTSLRPITAARSGVDRANRYRRRLSGIPQGDRNMQQNPVLAHCCNVGLEKSVRFRTKAGMA